MIPRNKVLKLADDHIFQYSGANLMFLILTVVLHIHFSFIIQKLVFNLTYYISITNIKQIRVLC
jgi:hypothetical protein